MTSRLRRWAIGWLMNRVVLPRVARFEWDNWGEIRELDPDRVTVVMTDE